MKKTILVLFLFVTVITLSQSRITYNVSFNKPNFSDLKKKISKQRFNRIKQAIRESEDVEATLLYKNNKSLYYLKDKMRNDSQKKINFTKLFAGNNKKFYADYENKDFFYQIDILGENILVEILPINWKLTQKTKKIGKYLCYKAINLDSKNQQTIAWYTLDVPIKAGPKKYYGLPGLIIELQESSNYIFRVTKIELNVKDIKIKKPKGVKRLTAKEYKEIKMKNSPFKLK